jgi:IS5 family transposase
VHTVVATAAHEHDVTQAHALLHGEETDVFADAGYVGVAKREENQGCAVNWHVAMRPGKRRALPETSLGKVLEALEHTKARIRAKVEHPFHVVKNLFKHRKARYRGMAKNAAQLLTLFGLANLMLAKRRFMAFHAQVAS